MLVDSDEFLHHADSDRERLLRGTVVPRSEHMRLHELHRAVHRPVPPPSAHGDAAVSATVGRNRVLDHGIVVTGRDDGGTSVASVRIDVDLVLGFA